MIFGLGIGLNVGVEVKCEFGTADWWVLDGIYRCKSRNQGDIITEQNNREITKIAGEHDDSKTNFNVKGVLIVNSNVFYFPRGLSNVFPNLEGISIWSSNLKEITQEDLKDLTNLRYIKLDDNQIQILGEKLFQNNPKLELFSAMRNQISHIDSNIFNNFVNKLSFLYLSDNICEFEDAYNNKEKVNQIIKKIQSGSCTNESKLPQTTTTTTTPKTTTTTTSAPPVTSAQCDSALIEELTRKNKILTEENAKINAELKKVEKVIDDLLFYTYDIQNMTREISELKENILLKLTPCADN